MPGGLPQDYNGAIVHETNEVVIELEEPEQDNLQAVRDAGVFISSKEYADKFMQNINEREAQEQTNRAADYDAHADDGVPEMHVNSQAGSHTSVVEDLPDIATNTDHRKIPAKDVQQV